VERYLHFPYTFMTCEISPLFVFIIIIYQDHTFITVDAVLPVRIQIKLWIYAFPISVNDFVCVLR